MSNKFYILDPLKSLHNKKILCYYKNEFNCTSLSISLIIYITLISLYTILFLLYIFLYIFYLLYFYIVYYLYFYKYINLLNL